MDLKKIESLSIDLQKLLKINRVSAEKVFQELTEQEQVNLINNTPASVARELIFLSVDAKTILKNVTTNKFGQLALQEYLEDSLVLFANCTPAQFAFTLDIDLWRKGQIDQTRFLEWIEIIKELPTKQFKILCSHIDKELLTTCLKQYVVVNVSVEELLLMEHTDNIYQYHMNDIDIVNAEVEAFVKFVEISSPEYFQDIIKLLSMGDLESLGNEAKGFRDDRVSKDKLPSYEAAQNIYQAVEELDFSPLRKHLAESDSIEIVTSEKIVPSFLEDLIRSNEFKQIYTKEKTNLFQSGLANLVNYVLVADGISPTDEQKYRQTFVKSNLIYQLGLEFLSDRSTHKAITVLQNHTAIELFQTGFTLIQYLRKKAADILDDDDEIIQRYTKKATLTLRLIDFDIPKFYIKDIKSAKQIKSYAEYLLLIKEVQLADDFRKDI